MCGKNPTIQNICQESCGVCRKPTAGELIQGKGKLFEIILGILNKCFNMIFFRNTRSKMF